MPSNADHVSPAKGVNAMTLRHHFHAYLDDIRREGRYRIFTDLERDPPGRPMHAGVMAASAAKSSYGVPMTTLGWGTHPTCCRCHGQNGAPRGHRCRGERNIAGNSHAVVALEEDSPTCIARRPHSPSRPVMSPMRRRWAHRQASAELPDPIGREEPRLDDRRHPGERSRQEDLSAQ